MCVVSSGRFSRIEDYEPMRMVTACLYPEVEDCEPRLTASAHRFFSVEDYGTMHGYMRDTGSPAARYRNRFGGSVHFGAD